ncbi:MAG: MBL fold metallo-hydrolase [Salinivirgaceae bacterium]|jgi:phosphoribosyl 1,2-cyclic phosphodiesterase|nr:MBL fold metallo-hydrolase [Salinivirgaceae bacterium]
MVKICALASGSNGNCYYIGNEEEAVLVDIGLTNRQLTQRLSDAKLSLKKIKAVFITHEHTDHVKGMRIVCAKNTIKGYANQKTYDKTRPDYRSSKINIFNAGDTITVGNIKVHSFTKQHDAIDPVSFRIEIDRMNITVLTDLGVPCENVRTHLALSDAAFLESNYDLDILLAGNYPPFLKHRVSGNKGHLSNEQALRLVKELNGSPLKTIFLSHISEDNNRVGLALDSFKELKESHAIYGTSRYGSSKVVEL